MPNRILKESICTSDTLDQLTAEEECFFYRLIVNCDDFGLMDAREAVLRSRLYPLRVDRVKTDEMLGYLARLQAVGLIEVYEVRGRRYLHITSWDDHQQRRAQKPKFPLPNDPGATTIALAPLPAHSNQSANLQSIDCNGNQLQSHVPVFVSGNVSGSRERTNARSDENEENAAHAAPPSGGISFLPSTDGPLYERYAERLKKPGNKHAVLAEAYSELFGTRYPPDFGRIGAMAKKIHAGEFLKLMINCAATYSGVDDPHDYLAKSVTRKTEEKSSSNGHVEPKPMTGDEIRALREAQDAECLKNTTPTNYQRTTMNGLSSRPASSMSSRTLPSKFGSG